MHWASCHHSGFAVENDGKVAITPSDCMRRLAKEKTNGEMPKFTFNSETNKISVEVATGFPVIGQVTLEFDQVLLARLFSFPSLWVCYTFRPHSFFSIHINLKKRTGVHVEVLVLWHSEYCCVQVFI